MKRYITSSLTDPIQSSELSKERLETIVTFTADILQDNSIGTSNQLLKILKLFEHYNLV